MSVEQLFVSMLAIGPIAVISVLLARSERICMLGYAGVTLPSIVLLLVSASSYRAVGAFAVQPAPSLAAVAFRCAGLSWLLWTVAVVLWPLTSAGRKPAAGLRLRLATWWHARRAQRRELPSARVISLRSDGT